MNLVTLNKNHQPTTTSKVIADVFGKTHAHVMRDIQKLEIPEDFGKSNFGLSSFHAGTRDYPMYEITHDGFTLLAMGFTGKRAMEWKIKFITAFRAMEARLKELVTVPAHVDMNAIGGMVKKCCAVAVRQELNAILAGDPKADWEVSDQDLIYQLHRWHATKSRADTEEFRRLVSENEELKKKIAAIKKAVR